jgi:drug/metabolite transporter (DMT)-like permease
MTALPQPTHSRFRIALAFAVIYLGWGSTFLAVRLAVASIPPFMVGASRNLVAGILMVGAGLATGARWPGVTAWRHALVIGTCLFVANHGAIAWASRRNPSGLTALLVATIPLWIVVLDWAFRGGRRPTARTAWGLGLGFLGSVLLFLPSDGGPTMDRVASLVTAVAAVSWAAGTLTARSAHLSDSVVMATGLPMLVGGLVLTLLAVAAGEPQALMAADVTASAAWSVVYLIGMGSLAGFSAYLYLLKALPASRVATYAYVNPIVALALGAWLGGETVGALTLVAAAVSLLGVYLSVSER